jgi:hypothetical protein
MKNLKKEAYNLYPEPENKYRKNTLKIYRNIWISGASSKEAEQYWIRKRTSRANIFLRIAGFFPFAVLAILFSFSLFVRYLINFIRFGGEAITYTHKNQRNTIEDLYQELKKNNEK